MRKLLLMTAAFAFGSIALFSSSVMAQQTHASCLAKCDNQRSMCLMDCGPDTACAFGCNYQRNNCGRACP